MPCAVKVARLAQLCHELGNDLPPSGQAALLGRSKRRNEAPVSVAPPNEKRAWSNQGLSTRVEQLSTDLAEMKSLFQECQLWKAAVAGHPASGRVHPKKCFFQARTSPFSLLCHSIRGVPEGVVRLLARPWNLCMPPHRWSGVWSICCRLNPLLPCSSCHWRMPCTPIFSAHRLNVMLQMTSSVKLIMPEHMLAASVIP